MSVVPSIYQRIMFLSDSLYLLLCRDDFKDVLWPGAVA